MNQADATTPVIDPNSVEVMEGREREQLEGWIPSLASEN